MSLDRWKLDKTMVSGTFQLVVPVPLHEEGHVQMIFHNTVTNVVKRNCAERLEVLQNIVDKNFGPESKEHIALSRLVRKYL